MNRPALVTGALVVVALVAFVLSERGDSGEGDVERTTLSGGEAPGTAPVPDLASANGFSRKADRMLSDGWTVVVQNADREPVPDAVLVATSGEYRRESSDGGAEWEDVVAGDWMLTVTAPGLPEWSRNVTVPPGRPWRTIVTLGQRLRLDGLVRDTSGAPQYAHLVGFVPLGKEAPTNVREWLKLPHARTERGGAFRGELPGQGTYRLFVGFGGKIVYEDADPVTFTAAGPQYVSVVIPETTSLVVTMREEGGADLSGAYGVSVYREKAIMDAVRPIPDLPEPQPLPDPNDPSLDEESRAEAAAEIAEFNRQLSAEQLAAIERRRSVVPEGWRCDRSAIVDLRGELTLTDLPAGEELRFAALRDQEPFFVDGSAWLVERESNRVIITLPPRLPADAPLGDTARTASLRVEPLGPRRERLDVGATWR